MMDQVLLVQKVEERKYIHQEHITILVQFLIGHAMKIHGVEYHLGQFLLEMHGQLNCKLVVMTQLANKVSEM